MDILIDVAKSIPLVVFIFMLTDRISNEFAKCEDENYQYKYYIINLVVNLGIICFGMIFFYDGSKYENRNIWMGLTGGSILSIFNIGIINWKNLDNITKIILLIIATSFSIVYYQS
jgi:hypothetical protein